eukprot:6491065-Amphidinium_carterae.2
MMNIRAPNSGDKNSTTCLLGLERFEDAIPPSTARGSRDMMPDECTTTPAPPMESDDLESEEIDATLDRTLNDASSFAHQVHHLPNNPLCRHCVMFKTKASPARVRKISLSEQASITEAFQVNTLPYSQGWIYAYPVVDKSKPKVERLLRHIIGARSSYKMLVSDSAPELLAANTFNLAHFALTPERPQQTLVSELAGIYLQQSGLPKEIVWKAAVRTAATALSLIPRAGRKSAFEVTFETPAWLADIPCGSLVWAPLNPSQMVKGEARERWEHKAFVVGLHLGGQESTSEQFDRNTLFRPQYLVIDWLQVSGVQNSQIQELDDFEGELESEIEDENNPVEEVSEILKLELQPPATEKEITQRAKRDEKVAEWHMKILVKPGVERTDWPDGVPRRTDGRNGLKRGSQTYKLSLDIGNTAQVLQQLLSHVELMVE